ncbi:MAG: hypothetical protein JW843_08700 [Candidatus Aminicenantes bacterium]|nr:hypothetical protein [Candidatus Aminicenantes bacterium]
MKKIVLSGAALFLVLNLGGFDFAGSGGKTAPPAGLDSAAWAGLRYRCIGPSRGGRVTAVAGVPSEPMTFYMGSTGGGIWKTTDAGRAWTNISDGFFATPSIGAIRVAPSAPNIIYAGTGSDGIRSNVITGRGVYKSTDEGKTWSFLGLGDTGQIGAVEIHPANPDIVFVAALGHPFGPNPDRGVFRTRNGGATWENVLFLSDRTGAVDLEIAPGRPDTIYASMWRGERKPWTIISGGGEDGVFRSTDGGTTWKRLTEGLPSGLVGKSDLAVSAAAPDRLYILLEAPEGEGGLYRSDDRGGHFTLVSTYAPLLDRPFYYCNLDADPTNADVLYVNSTQFFRSSDGGKTWTRRPTPHGDNHDMWINPRNPDIFIQSNDGGANVTLDGGRSWSTLDNQPTAELYQVAVDDQFPYWVYAGQQDNTTIAVPSLPPFNPAGGPQAFWLEVGGCETGPAVPKPGDPNIVYANCKGIFGRYDKRTGQEKLYPVGGANLYGHNPKDLKFRFQRVAPIVVSPHDPNVVYHASQYLHRTTDEGVSWETISPDLTAFDPDRQVVSGEPLTRDITGEEYYSTLYAVAESPLQKGLIWTGANDGPVHITRDGGATWSRVTPPGLPPGGRVQTIEPSPHRSGKAYVAVYRYLLDDWAPYLFKTEDYGKTWKRLTTGRNGIPADTPTRVVREDPNREGLLYAGTEFGMYLSFDDGENWTPFQLNLPVTPITDIKIFRNDLVLSTMGRSFWILDNLTPLHQWNPNGDSSAPRLFSPVEAVRMRYRAGGRGPSDPQYPAPGAVIDFSLPADPKAEVKLEIIDADGNPVKTVSNRSGLPRLPAEAGHNRFIWDFRRDIPAGPAGTAADPQPSRSRGPMVPPGMYRVRMTTGGWSGEKTLSVVLDPRLAASAVTVEDLKEQERLLIEILKLQAEARSTAARVESELKAAEEAAKIPGQAGNRARDRAVALRSLRAEMVTAGGRYPQPMLLDQIGTLAGRLDQADQKPGRDVYKRYEELAGFLERIKTALRDAS